MRIADENRVDHLINSYFKRWLFVVDSVFQFCVLTITNFPSFQQIISSQSHILKLGRLSLALYLLVGFHSL
jgi:hypothetical protein